jgi:hypothetical protein
MKRATMIQASRSRLLLGAAWLAVVFVNRTGPCPGIVDLRPVPEFSNTLPALHWQSIALRPRRIEIFVAQLRGYVDSAAVRWYKKRIEFRRKMWHVIHRSSRDIIKA